MTTPMLQLLEDNPLLYLLVLAGVVGSIVLHELGHGLVATWQGDPTPRMLGHLTWNPKVHMGWLGLGLAAFVGIAFGAMPVNPRLFRDRRWGDTLVSAAGPAVNLALALVMSILLGFILRFSPELFRSGLESAGGLFAWFVLYLAGLNFVLFGFNMLPVPPFDGFKVFAGFFDFGALGPFLRNAQPWPLVIAFVLIMNTDVFGIAMDSAGIIARGVAFLLGA